MRASISTWRTAMSILAISAWISSIFEVTSVTKSWLVRVSKITLPRGDMMRAADCPPDAALLPPPEFCPLKALATSSALV